MKIRNSFYQVVENHGGLLNLDSLIEPKRSLAKMVLDVACQTRKVLNSSDLLYPLGDAEIVLVQNNEFNAFAHHDKGCEGIAIYSGLFEVLCTRAVELWSDSGLHSQPRVGSRASAILESMLPRNMIEQWHMTPKENMGQKELFERRLNLALTGLSFVLMHEIGHLVQAHIPFLDQRSSGGVQTLFEHGNSNTIASNEELQFLEVDADDHAICAIMDMAMTTWQMGRIYPINFDYCNKSNVFPYLVDIFRGVALAHFCMDEHSINNNLHASGSHPRPAIRAGLAALCGGRLLDHPFKIPMNVTLSAVIAAYLEVGALYSRLGYNAPTFENDIRQILELAGDTLKKASAFLKLKAEAVNCRLSSLGVDPKNHHDKHKDFYKKPPANQTKG